MVPICARVGSLKYSLKYGPLFSAYQHSARRVARETRSSRGDIRDDPGHNTLIISKKEHPQTDKYTGKISVFHVKPWFLVHDMERIWARTVRASP